MNMTGKLSIILKKESRWTKICTGPLTIKKETPGTSRAYTC
jgi:hypothetical protein